MTTLNILIDSSTKRSAPTNQYGQSAFAWAAWEALSGQTEIQPIRSAVTFFQHAGPNRTFYQGVIRSLEQCLEICRNTAVVVWGDCEPVLSQLNGRRTPREMMREYSQVQALAKKYKEKGNAISFEYMSESHPMYYAIDQLSKHGRNWIRTTLATQFQLGKRRAVLSQGTYRKTRVAPR